MHTFDYHVIFLLLYSVKHVILITEQIEEAVNMCLTKTVIKLTGYWLPYIIHVGPLNSKSTEINTYKTHERSHENICKQRLLE